MALLICVASLIPHRAQERGVAKGGQAGTDDCEGTKAQAGKEPTGGWHVVQSDAEVHATDQEERVEMSQCKEDDKEGAFSSHSHGTEEVESTNDQDNAQGNRSKEYKAEEKILFVLVFHIFAQVFAVTNHPNTIRPSKM